MPVPIGNGIQYKWENLQTIGGNISYSLCPATSTWRAGIEYWDSYLGTRMDFNEFTCGQNVRTFVRSESGNECPPTESGGVAYACWRDIDVDCVGSVCELEEAEILFDPSYFGLSISWQYQMAAHEWGHNLNLGHHPTDSPCTLPGVMAYKDTAINPCFYVPAGGEIHTVECAVYYTCGWNPPSSWTGWVETAGNPTGVSYDRPEVAGHTHMVRTSGNDVWVRYWSGSAWTGWTNWSSDTSVSFTGQAAVTNHDQWVHVAAVSASKVYYKRSGSTWMDLGKPTTAGFDGPVAITNAGNTVQVVGIAQGDAWFKKRDTLTGAWTSWQFLGRPAGGNPLSTSVAIATSPHGLHHVVALRPYDSTAWMTWWNGSQWVGWQSLGCCVAGGLAIDNSFADVGNAGAPYTGVHVAMIVELGRPRSLLGGLLPRRLVEHRRGIPGTRSPRELRRDTRDRDQWDCPVPPRVRTTIAADPRRSAAASLKNSCSGQSHSC
jgi:hypothetical protein